MNMLTRVEPEDGKVTRTAAVRFRSLPKWQRSSLLAAPLALLIAGGAILANDEGRARVQAPQAALAGAEARVRARALDVEFTQIRAPIGGRISDRRVDAGNLVSAGEGAAGSLLTTINALDPIYFTFDASEALFLKTQREHESGGRA